jgi:hypothetical protein
MQRLKKLGETIQHSFYENLKDPQSETTMHLSIEATSFQMSSWEVISWGRVGDMNYQLPSLLI